MGNLKVKLIAAGGAALAVLIFVGVLSYRWTIKADEDQGWVAHTHSVLERLDGLLADLILEERDQRDYIFAGADSYLAAYEADLVSVEDDLKSLRELTADNPRQQESLAQLRPLVASRQSAVREGIEVRKREGLIPGIASVRAGAEKQSFEGIRSLLNNMKQEENRLLTERLKTAQKSSRRMKDVIFWGNAIALIFFATAALTTYREMSRRRTAEEALGQSEERFRLMVSTIKDYAILMLDPTGHVVSWNAGAERIKGYKAEEIIGQHFSRFYPAEDKAQGKPQYELDTAVEQGQFEYEGWRVRKDGSQFWANVIVTAIRDDSGRLRGFSKVTRDMTERRRVEEAIRVQNAQLEAANKELEAFSYSVSHDLRSPLRSIDGFSSALLEDYQQGLDEQGKSYLERIRAATVRMGHLIDDMLKLARISRYEITHDEINLSRLAREVASQLQAADPSRNADFSIAPGLITVGDRSLLRIVLENLLGNAWKFTSKQEHSFIEVGIEEDNGRQIFFVRDNGPGFDMQYADKLFGVFQRLHRESEFTGTGVGLATVQRIIHRHGGNVWAKAAPGQGATFYFALQPTIERLISNERY